MLYGSGLTHLPILTGVLIMCLVLVQHYMSLCLSRSDGLLLLCVCLSVRLAGSFALQYFVSDS